MATRKSTPVSLSRDGHAHDRVPAAAELRRNRPKAEDTGTLSHGEARSLRAKCDSAQRSAASGHTKAARNKLKAFIHEVRAMVRSRRISSALGQELIDSANARIATLL